MHPNPHHMKRPAPFGLSGTLMFLLAAFGNAQAGVDAEAAQAFARRSNCFKCHAVDAPKQAPAFKAIAAKFRDQADARQKVITHLSMGNTVKLTDGSEEDHKIIDSRDKAAVLNLVDWILAQ